MAQLYPRIAALVFASAALNATAQDWTVGWPVDFQLTQMTVNGGGCYPNADATLNFPTSTVSGIVHVAIVTAVQPAGVNTIAPGSSGPLNVGDTVYFDTPGVRSCHFPQGNGTVSLDFRAIGIPTQEGQPHPCAFNQIWLSNLMLCPEGLSKGLSSGCTVQPSSLGLSGVVAGSNSVDLPNATNGWVLNVSGAAYGAEVFDAVGNRMAAMGSGSLAFTWPDGLYFVRIRSAAGVRTERVLVSRR